MSKKVLVLLGSPRVKGNCDIICDEFIKGALAKGHQVEKIYVGNKDIHPCSACYHCQNHQGECIYQDDMKEILNKMIETDVLVLASPVYFYSISAQLKAVIDRSVARWLEVNNKELYYIIAMADEELKAADTTLACFRGYADCVKGAIEKGVLIANGVYDKGEVIDHEVLKQAYEMGNNI